MSPDRLRFSPPDGTGSIEKLRFPVERVLVAGNRGPCGGVRMAIETTRQVLAIVAGKEKVYTNWPPINNTRIMRKFEEDGLECFWNDWSRVPDGSLVLFSAHGVPEEDYVIAQAKNCDTVDTTCQLVEKVIAQAKKAEREGIPIAYFGTPNHPEPRAILGSIAQDHIIFFTSIEDVRKTQFPNGAIALSQTTLSTEEIAAMHAELELRNPDVQIKNDICDATDVRQSAVRDLIGNVDMEIVVGSSHSHNSEELRRIGEKRGKPSYLIDGADEIDRSWFTTNIRIIGLSSGASALDEYTEEVLDWFRNEGVEIVYLDPVRDEKPVTFKLPQKDIDRVRARYAA